jgi:glycosyltransferase involved in cell wall biosynthesis
MHVVLFEPNAHGHRYTHIRRLAPTIAGLGVRLTLVTARESLATAEFKAQIEPLGSTLNIEAGRSYPIGEGTTYLRAAAAGLRWTARHLRPDHLYVPYADGTIQIVGARRLVGTFGIPASVEIEGLMMRGEFAYPKRRTPLIRLRHETWLTCTAAAPFRTIHHMDPLIAEALAARRSSLRPRVRLIADPVEAFTPTTPAEARRRLGIPEDGRYIGCVGYQDTRKGIDLLIRAFLQARVSPTDRLLLAGGQEAQVRALLDEPEPQAAIRQGRIVLIKRYISDEELMLGIAAMDVVATPYPPDRAHVGSSSIVIHAASQGRPVLGTDSGWVGHTIRRFGLGWTCGVNDPGEFAGAIRSALESAGSYRPGEASRRFSEFHRPENFVSGFCRRLRERLGAPQPAGLREWSWVLEAAGDPAKAGPYPQPVR